MKVNYNNKTKYVYRYIPKKYIDQQYDDNYANDLWSRNLPIEAARGKIYDRNGVELASNVTTTSLVLIPNQINDKEKEQEQEEKRLAKEEKAKAKAKKIERDKKLREQKKQAKGEQ